MAVHAHTEEKSKSPLSPSKGDRDAGASDFSGGSGPAPVWDRGESRPLASMRRSDGGGSSGGSSRASYSSDSSSSSDSGASLGGLTLGPGAEAALQGEVAQGASVDTGSMDVRQRGVNASTHGRRASFDPASYNPSDSAGARLIGHESVHLAQARLGEKPGAAHASTSALEAEASSAGSALARGEQAQVNLAAPSGVTLNDPAGEKVTLSAARKAQIDKMSLKELEYVIYTAEKDPTKQEEKEYAEHTKAKLEEAAREKWKSKDYKEDDWDNPERFGEEEHKFEAKSHEYSLGSQYTRTSSTENAGTPQSRKEKQENKQILGSRKKDSTTTSTDGDKTTTTSTSTKRGKDATTRTVSTSESDAHGSKESTETTTVNRGDKSKTTKTTSKEKRDLDAARREEEEEAKKEKEHEKGSIKDKVKESVKIKMAAEKSLHEFEEKKTRKGETELTSQSGHETKATGSIEGNLAGKLKAQGGVERTDVFGAKGKAETKLGEKTKGVGEYDLLTTKVNAGGSAEWDPSKGLTVEGTAGAKATLAGGSYKLEFGPYDFELLQEKIKASFTAGVAAEVAAEAKGSIKVDVQRGGDGVSIDTGLGSKAASRGADVGAGVSAFAGARAGFEIGTRLDWLKNPDYKEKLSNKVTELLKEYAPGWLVDLLPSSCIQTLAGTLGKIIFGEGGPSTLLAAKGGVEGTAGIGGEASFNLGLKGGRIKMSTKLQGTIGLGVGGKLNLDLDAIDGMRFLGLMMFRGAEAILQRFGFSPSAIWAKIKSGYEAAKKWLGQQIYEMCTSGILDYAVPDSLAETIAKSLGYNPP